MTRCKVDTPRSGVYDSSDTTPTRERCLAMETSIDRSKLYRGLVAGDLISGSQELSVKSPFDGEPVGRVSLLDTGQVRSAIDAAVRAVGAARTMPSHERAEVLLGIREAISERMESLAILLAHEAGKPISAARLELDRTLSVFQLASEEAKRIGGEVLPLDSISAGNNRWGITRRFPLSPISAITPFNFPILLAAHKLAPAIACGATIVLKPPPQDPLTTLLLGEIIADSGYPAGAVNVVPCTVEDAAPLIDDPRVKMISFTGSARAGWAIRGRAAKKRITLELGGNAGVIVECDADIEYAAQRCAAGGFGYAGQSCISVQRILVHKNVYEAFLKRFCEIVSQLKCGDPLDEDTDVGPLIDSDSAKRTQAWIEEACAGGAEVAAGGGRNGPVIEPTVLVGTTSDMKVNCEEVFAPVVTVSQYSDFDDALATINDSPYGLQAGVFTHDQRKIWKAFEQLEVGGVIANDISSFRVDAMPYGGVKESGLGREGVRYAIEEMTEIRLLVL